MGYYLIPGTNNLAPYITPGATQDVANDNITCIGNNFDVIVSFAELRLFFSN